jgi:hypothetical protein
MLVYIIYLSRQQHMGYNFLHFGLWTKHFFEKSCVVDPDPYLDPIRIGSGFSSVSGPVSGSSGAK